MVRMSLLGALLALSAGAVTGCAGGSAQSSAPTASRPPHLRCMSESSPGADRPLFFLFCVQSP